MPITDEKRLLSRKRWERYGLTFEPEAGGMQFVGPDHVDLSGVRVLAAGVDTVRQLYRGSVRREIVEMFEASLDGGVREPFVDLRGETWVVGYGGQSGYRWRLQNNELGLILFVGSRFAELGEVGSHLKIECSPHWIRARRPVVAQQDLSGLASFVLAESSPAGCAVHLAVDVTGWCPPSDFVERLTTRSRRRMVHDGISGVELLGGETVQTYGDRESFLFGSANGIQFACYEKTREARKRDKLDFWSDVWGMGVDDVLSLQGGVWRLEWRFHHTVVGQFSGDYLTYERVFRDLTGIFRYGLGTFRLDYSRVYIDPLWQLLYEDVRFSSGGVDAVRRSYKTPGLGSERNVAALIGNAITVYARNDWSARELLAWLQGSHIWPEVRAYYGRRGADIYAVLERGLALRRLVGRAA